MRCFSLAPPIPSCRGCARRLRSHFSFRLGFGNNVLSLRRFFVGYFLRDRCLCCRLLLDYFRDRRLCRWFFFDYFFRDRRLCRRCFCRRFFFDYFFRDRCFCGSSSLINSSASGAAAAGSSSMASAGGAASTGNSS